ncbi:MAG: hypothetical protein NG747_11280 [Candidatus Brocadia sp.]|nr:hypothetical protein [Candidatus Brocadia sp.]
MLDTIKLLNEEIKKHEPELNFKDTVNGIRITQTDIEQARAYPMKTYL